jgi:RNA polymerase sigma-70 factor (ECF subfamily)
LLMEISMTYHASEEIHNSMPDIIAKAQSGDKEAFGLIFEEHHRFIYKFIYAMLGECSLAEELTQETFLRAYKSIYFLRNESTLRTWLCGIAKNVVFSSYRDRKKEKNISAEKPEDLNLLDDKNPAPDANFLNKELNQIIYSALRKLSEDKRIVFILKEMQNLNYQEISEITGNGIPKLKTDLFRAKVEMRMLIRPYMEAKK